MARRGRVPRRKALGAAHRQRNKNPKLSPFQREQKRDKLANRPPLPSIKEKIRRSGGKRGSGEEQFSGKHKDLLMYLARKQQQRKEAGIRKFGDKGVEKEKEEELEAPQDTKENKKRAKHAAVSTSSDAEKFKEMKSSLKKEGKKILAEAPTEEALGELEVPAKRKKRTRSVGTGSYVHNNNSSRNNQRSTKKNSSGLEVSDDEEQGAVIIAPSKVAPVCDFSQEAMIQEEDLLEKGLRGRRQTLKEKKKMKKFQSKKERAEADVHEFEKSMVSPKARKKEEKEEKKRRRIEAQNRRLKEAEERLNPQLHQGEGEKKFVVKRLSQTQYNEFEDMHDTVRFGERVDAPPVFDTSFVSKPLVKMTVRTPAEKKSTTVSTQLGRGHQHLKGAITAEGFEQHKLVKLGLAARPTNQVGHQQEGGPHSLSQSSGKDQNLSRSLVGSNKGDTSSTGTNKAMTDSFEAYRNRVLQAYAASKLKRSTVRGTQS